MFDAVFHADWSTRPQGRWVAAARRGPAGWHVAAPEPVGDLATFRDSLRAAAREGAVLAGFDFPIGVPAAYGARTGVRDFRDVLRHAGTAEAWRDFYRVAAQGAEVSVRRPFYPGGTGAGATLSSLVAGLGLDTADDLLRDCERGGPGRRRASPLFWTVGAAQVGRAAAVGWQEVVAPLVAAGAALWPFDGALDALAGSRGLVVAETYPADAYAAVGAPFWPGESKRRQADRARKAEAVLRWAAARGIDLAACEAVLRDGFGPAPAAEDPFDALLGLLAMLPVVAEPARAMRTVPSPGRLAWEGWILGR